MPNSRLDTFDTRMHTVNGRCVLMVLSSGIEFYGLNRRERSTVDPRYLDFDYLE